VTNSSVPLLKAPTCGILSTAIYSRSLRRLACRVDYERKDLSVCILLGGVHDALICQVGHDPLLFLLLLYEGGSPLPGRDGALTEGSDPPYDGLAIVNDGGLALGLNESVVTVIQNTLVERGAQSTEKLPEAGV
jgi:hypothetical protein